ncbi:helix-turn-helix domain-containing protein [Leucobacter coleopterorum]|uniref:Helix-turn-helix domain-containing protein n=1 Tax=Leucobacter coleopterorum TaxID=2714933 RepID=A0ABX6JYW5_9MICO|nr:helix-turn-helix domain-containing protein [Leucobacter coleopterorum]QIM19512.1 helix-turn-helix domain-containing protein [Leucobacter coleopterorum]
MLNVALLLLPNARVFDVAVMTETWQAERLSSPPLAIRVRHCAAKPDVVKLGNNATMVADEDLLWLEKADVVLVPGLSSLDSLPSRNYLEALEQAHSAGATVASLCSGAFVLAVAGLLDGKRATTHWALAPRLAAHFPNVTVASDELFIGQDRVWTSAGVAAGIDLSIHLIRELLGAGAATNIARSMVAAPNRAGGQAQFLRAPVRAAAGIGTALGIVQAAVEEHPDHNWSVADLAARAHLAERTFVRHFNDETGTSPHRWFTEWRIDRASALLEQGASVSEAATAVGYGSVVTFRQRFRELRKVSPSQYRAAFGREPAA